MALLGLGLYWGQSYSFTGTDYIGDSPIALLGLGLY